MAKGNFVREWRILYILFSYHDNAHHKLSDLEANSLPTESWIGLDSPTIDIYKLKIYKNNIIFSFVHKFKF